jgi:hypothetical protein
MMRVSMDIRTRGHLINGRDEKRREEKRREELPQGLKPDFACL